MLHILCTSNIRLRHTHIYIYVYPYRDICVYISIDVCTFSICRCIYVQYFLTHTHIYIYDSCCIRHTCCNTLQQCVALCCSVFCIVFHCVSVCCSVLLQCVAVCCSMYDICNEQYQITTHTHIYLCISIYVCE